MQDGNLTNPLVCVKLSHTNCHFAAKNI